MDAAALADELEVSAMAIRQHLYSFEAEGLVEAAEEARPMGRPAKIWSLTRDADQCYPNGHADLTVELLRNIRSAFGEKGIKKILDVRSRDMAEAYSRELADRSTLASRLRTLARIRTREGYMAGVETEPDGSALLVENHCPICEAATECQGLCAKELDVFREVLGTAVQVERVEHIQGGARRCAYRVTPANE